MASRSARSSGCCSRRRSLGPRRSRARSAGWAATSGRACPASDAKEFGELIDAGEACLLVVGESTVQAAIDKAGLKAERQVEKQLDVSAKDLDKAVQETAKELN